MKPCGAARKRGAVAIGYIAYFPERCGGPWAANWLFRTRRSIVVRVGHLRGDVAFLKALKLLAVIGVFGLDRDAVFHGLNGLFFLAATEMHLCQRIQIAGCLGLQLDRRLGVREGVVQIASAVGRQPGARIVRMSTAWIGAAEFLVLIEHFVKQGIGLLSTA